MSAAAIVQQFTDDAVLGIGVRSPYSQATAKVMGYAVRSFLTWLEQERGVSILDVSPEYIRSYVAYLFTTNARNKDTRRSPNSVYRILMQLRAFCRWAVDMDLLDSDPTAGIKGPKRIQAFIEPYSDGELGMILRACGRGCSPEILARNQAIVYLLAFTGIRMAELLRLRREDLQGRDTVTLLGKGHKMRTVAIHPHVRDALTAYWALRRSDSPMAFVNVHGEPLTHVALRQTLKALGMQLGFPVGAHALRRTAFTRMAVEGFSVFELKALGGWSTFVAADQYVRRGAERAALEKHRAFHPSPELDVRPQGASIPTEYPHALLQDPDRAPLENVRGYTRR